MELHQCPAFVTHTGTATVRVLEFGHPGLLNPNPVVKDETGLLIEEYLSPAKLVRHLKQILWKGIYAKC